MSNRVGLAAGLVVPSMDAVLRWACATLDTHFVTLAGLPVGAQQALLSLQERIQESLQVCCSISQHKACFLSNCSLADLSTWGVIAGCCGHVYDVEGDILNGEAP